MTAATHTSDDDAIEAMKPCPFCGGEAHHNDGGGSVYGRFWWRVGCPDCGVSFADEERWDAERPGMLDPAYPPKHCFAAWNRRVALDAISQHAPVPDAELDALQERLADECAVLGAKASRALSALRTRIAEVEQQRDAAVRIGAEHMARGDRLERELATALAGAVEVRPLEWTGGETYAAAECAVGEYIIGSGKCFGDGTTWWAWLHRTHDDGSTPYFNGTNAESMEAAKAAAQADYRARILAAIRPSPDALQAVTSAAYEAVGLALDAVADNWSCGHMPPHCDCPRDIEQWRFAADEARAAIPTDALAAQTRRDAQMTAKGMRVAAEWHQEVAQHDQGGIEYSGAVGIPISNMVELQQSVKMHQWSAEWLIALAAQTEASSDGS